MGPAAGCGRRFDCDGFLEEWKCMARVTGEILNAVVLKYSFEYCMGLTFAREFFSSFFFFFFFLLDPSTIS